MRNYSWRVAPPAARMTAGLLLAVAMLLAAGRASRAQSMQIEDGRVAKIIASAQPFSLGLTMKEPLSLWPQSRVDPPECCLTMCRAAARALMKRDRTIAAGAAKRYRAQHVEITRPAGPGGSFGWIGGPAPISALRDDRRLPNH